VQDADNPGRPLVVGARQVKPLDQLLIGGDPGYRHRHRVGDLGDQRAERDDHLDAHPVGRAGDQVGEGAPAQVRLGAVEQDQIALGPRRTSGKQRVLGPLDVARLALGESDRWTVRLEVEELLRVDLGHHLRVERRGDRAERGRCGGRRIVPAAESADEDRRTKLGRVLVPLKRLHGMSVDHEQFALAGASGLRPPARAG